MQFRILSAFIIFLGSYLPLALILAVQDIDISWWQQDICGFDSIANCVFDPFSNPHLASSFLIITLLAVYLSDKSLSKIDYPFTATVTKSKSIPNDIINYVFPYVVSFMGISYDEPEKMLGFAVFLIWMFAITYKSGQIIMNPLLLMFGWKLHEASIKIDDHDRDVRILVKGPLKPGTYKVQSIQDFYIARSNDEC
tara:strand:+ start:2532 stop:3119 length:588 start_codon:yes stop_codon:yes gene_type:complete